MRLAATLINHYPERTRLTHQPAPGDEGLSAAEEERLLRDLAG
jgi:hypothetical protein